MIRLDAIESVMGAVATIFVLTFGGLTFTVCNPIWPSDGHNLEDIPEVSDEDLYHSAEDLQRLESSKHLEGELREIQRDRHEIEKQQRLILEHLADLEERL